MKQPESDLCYVKAGRAALLGLAVALLQQNPWKTNSH